MTFLFHLVLHDRVRRSVQAPDLPTAQLKLLWRPGFPGQVVSDASHRLGLPKPLSAGMCVSCGQRPISGPKVPRCASCDERVRREQVAARKASGRTRKRRAQ